MRVLVTGGAGFIGSHVADACLAAGHEVLVIDDLSSGKPENVARGARLEACDIRTPRAAAVVESFRPQALVHHAAQMSVTRSVAEPSFDAEVNVIGLINLVEAGRRAGLEKVVFASSGGTVYGEVEAYPIAETAPTHPVCPYGVSKLSGEHYLFYYRRVFGLPYVALRYANVYGPRQDPHGEAGVIAIFSKRLLAGEDVTIFGDGRQTRDYVFVGDVVRANLAALAGEFCGGVNIGTGVETNVNDLYAIIKRHAGGPGKAVHAAPRDGELRRSVLSAALAERVLGWKPRTTLTDGLAETVDFFRSRP
ncbi:MAG TPA: NAD-dependent epimerase/dehydratase family protein [Candidatus Binatia bacterium]|nr:NAD-dependent epimerase/dehydratase family protein [Candidatus Binatia bacterium]